METNTNKRIAKNTLLLYVRMAITLCVSLLTSRVVLDKLGIQDFGIYDVVFGIIAAFSFLFSSMSLGTQRFITFELGKKKDANLPRIFSMSINIQICIALIILALAETAGLWFLNSHLNIPHSRIHAANWIYQLSIISTVLNILLVPYNAIIIAHEKIGFYAWASIINVTLRLAIVYLLAIANFDKLIFYGVLGTIVSIVIQAVYIGYCKKQFKETVQFHVVRDKALFKEMFSFSGWCLLGGTTSITKNQGISIILNLFFGVTINAAMGISNRVAEAVNQFVANFQTAANPQIIKQYAAGEMESLSLLISRVSKFSYCLMLLMVLPLFLNIDFILQLWLVEVPAWTSEFVKWLLLFMLLDSLAGPQWMSILATGKIRNYYIIETAMTLCNIPICILLLKAGYSPVFALVCKNAINIAVLLWRATFMAKNVGISLSQYATKGILPIVAISPLAISIPAIARMNLPDGWICLIVTSTLSAISVISWTWIIGTTNEERSAIRSILLEKLIRQKS